MPRGSTPGSTLVVQVGTAGQVEGHVDERLVQRERDRREPAHAGLVAQRLPQALAQGDADVLDGVVGVDVEVARGRQVQVEPAVAAELGQHVVEERQAGGDVGLARAVEVETDLDRRLLGDPGSGGARVIAKGPP